MTRESKTPAPINTDALRAAIDDIAPRLGTLPGPSGAPGARGWYAALQIRQAAAQELVGHIRREHGARIALGGNTERMRLHGISVSCTSGPVNMIAAWLRKARAVLQQEEQAR